MLNARDILVYNIIAGVCFFIVLIFQWAEATVYVDSLGNLLFK